MAKLFKISHENELYLIRCPGPDSYLSQIQAAACERFRLPWLQDLVFFYRDQEGDKVFVASEEDLALALESEDAPLKLKLIPRRPRTTSAPAVVVAPESSVRHAAICDGCRAPIVGVRYKCGHCADFDFCAKCLPVVPHPEDHVFLICRRAISRHVKPLLPRLENAENAVLRGPTTTSPLHPCPLQLTLPYNGHYICNGCGMPGRGPAHHCAEHQFDLHPRCARPNLATTGLVLPLPPIASSAPSPVRPPAATSAPAPVRPPAATSAPAPVRRPAANSACAPVRPATPPTGMRPVPADNFDWVPSSAPASSACRSPVVRVHIAKKPEAESVAPVLPDLAKKPGAESVAPVLDLTSLVEPQPAGRLMKLSVPELAPAEPVVAAPAAPTTPASIDPVPSAPAAEPEPYEAELKTLLAMGFDRQVAEVVLNLRNGDIALCLSDLLGQ